MIIGCFGWFEKEGRVLLQQRSGTDRLANQWGLPGGGQEDGEDMRSCLAREIREETTIQIGEADIIHVQETINGSGLPILLTTWRIHDWRGEARVVEPEEAQAYEWFDLDDLPDNLLPNLGIAIQCIRDNIFYSQG